MNTLEESATTARLETWLAVNVEGYRGPGKLRKFGFGQSNPTFRLSTHDGVYVLRRKPGGPLLKGAHAIEREFKVLRALADTNVPVPRVYALCEDLSILGVPFYVMAFVQGRIFYDQRLPELSPLQRTEIFDAMNLAVAELHSIDPILTGLEGYGRPSDFLIRQVSLWTRQFRASEGTRIEAMERLIDWLPCNLPPRQPTRIFHGDLRIDNMIFHPTEARVVAFLDWELSTLGDAIADFAYHALIWRVSPELFRGLAGLDLRSLGIPTEEDYVSMYCRRTGKSELPGWNFYLAFSLFRLAAILQGIWRRALDGNASAQNASDLGARAGELADVGWAIASIG